MLPARVAGDGMIQSISDPIGLEHRFYLVKAVH